jgi:hypothetical protein
MARASCTERWRGPAVSNRGLPDATRYEANDCKLGPLPAGTLELRSRLGYAVAV